MAKLVSDFPGWGTVRDPETDERVQLNARGDVEDIDPDQAQRLADRYDPIHVVDDDEEPEGQARVARTVAEDDTESDDGAEGDREAVEALETEDDDNPTEDDGATQEPTADDDDVPTVVDESDAEELLSEHWNTVSGYIKTGSLDDQLDMLREVEKEGRDRNSVLSAIDDREDELNTDEDEGPNAGD